jgi:PIN domain nuclease of toxin-antitoxin system
LRLLLDTCAFLWLGSSPNKIPLKVRAILKNEQAGLYFSIASAWEIAIKSRRGQLRLPDDPQQFVSDRISFYRLNSLDITLPHAIRAGSLPLHHKDPFDRMLIAQAVIEGLAIVTPDSAFAPYDVPLFW